MTLKQMTKMRGWTHGSQKSHANQRNILCSMRTFASFSLSINCSALFVSRASTFIIYCLTTLSLCLAYLRA